MEGGENMEEIKRQKDRCQGIQKLVQRSDTTKSNLKEQSCEKPVH